jgi:UDP-N-acetylmuramate: L-alanyl-gamma-D-glutamyl-meso-diaminopimelate ligase
MRRKIFQHVLPDALAVADAVLIVPVNRAQLLEEEERLSPEQIADSLLERGRPAKAFESSDEIAEHLAENAKAGDMVIVMSNGSFDGLSGKLLEQFRLLAAARK